MSDTQPQTSPGVAQLDATLHALQGGLAAAAGAAGPNIAAWIQTLHGNTQLAGISAELQKLHDALQSGASDTGALASSLSTLGEHTTKVAEHATPDAQEKLRQLGHALSAAGTQLKG